MPSQLDLTFIQSEKKNKQFILFIHIYLVTNNLWIIGK